MEALIGVASSESGIGISMEKPVDGSHSQSWITGLKTNGNSKGVKVSP